MKLHLLERKNNMSKHQGNQNNLKIDFDLFLTIIRTTVIKSPKLDTQFNFTVVFDHFGQTV